MRRFDEKVLPTPSGCWEWAGWHNHKGYGMFWFEGRDQPAHRVSYTLSVGEIPAGLDLDHLCRNRGCVNPAHLEPVTRGENLLRGDTFNARNAAKTECPKGHPYDDKNTYTTRKGGRSCRTCHRERMRNA